MKRFLATALMMLSSMVFAGDRVQTPFGQISISRDNINISAVNGDFNIPIEKDVLSVYVKDYFLNKTEDAAIVVFIKYTGRHDCIANYFIYEINPLGENKQTPTFGTCSSEAKIQKEDNALTIRIPRIGKEEPAIFKYENGTIVEVVDLPKTKGASVPLKPKR